MVDVDHFKKVNDRHGHDIGDQVLKMVASRLTQVRGGGMAFRYGGEEFAVLFSGKGVGAALPHLEQLRESIETSAFTLRHKSRPKNQPARAPKQVGRNRLAVTVSIGVAERGGDATRPGAVVKAADQALYRAKQTGRNRICGKGVPAVAKGRAKT
jgi:diguanylate cyclase (GGDEF)-like protein